MSDDREPHHRHRPGAGGRGAPGALGAVRRLHRDAGHPGPVHGWWVCAQAGESDESQREPGHREEARRRDGLKRYRGIMRWLPQRSRSWCLPSARRGARGRCARLRAQPFQDLVPDPQSVGHDRERGIHRAARGEEAAVHHVEIIHLVRPAVRVQRRGPGIVPEADGAVLVRHARQRNPLADEQVAGEESLVAVVRRGRGSASAAASGARASR